MCFGMQEQALDKEVEDILAERKRIKEIQVDVEFNGSQL